MTVLLYLERRFFSWNCPSVSYRESNMEGTSIVSLSFDIHLNTPKPRRKVRHCADGISFVFFQWILLYFNSNHSDWGDNTSAFTGFVAWRRTGNKPLPEPMMNQFTDPCMRHQASICQVIVPCDISVIYRKISNIRRTKSPNLNVSSLVLQLSLHNPMQPGVKSRMKMKMEQRRQAMLQLHPSD